MKIKIKECVGNSRIYGEDGKLAGTIAKKRPGP